MLRQTIRYLLARGGPGLVNFLALSVVTRLVAPGEYGRYALVIASLTFTNSVGFQWLGLGLLRFYPSRRENPAALLSTVLAGFAILAAGALLVALGLAVIFRTPEWWQLIAFVVLILWSQAWLELNLTLCTLLDRPRRYGALSLARALTSLAIGSGLALAGFGAAGLLTGLLAGYTAPALWATRAAWRGASIRRADLTTLRSMFSYGLPLAATSALDYVVNISDRFLLQFFLGASVVGMYAAGYDLTQQSLVMLMIAINLGAYPALVQAFEAQQPEAARVRLAAHASLLMAVALPVTAGLSIMAPTIAAIMVGAPFRAAVQTLIPWIAVASLLLGMKAFYFDLAFQLGLHTRRQIIVNGFAALLNVGLNVVLIPAVGFLGAAYSTVAAYVVALLLSAWLGRSSADFPIPWSHWMRSAAAAAGMMAWIYMWPTMTHALPAALLAGSGALVYAAIAVALDVCGVRATVRAFIAARFPPAAPSLPTPHD